MRGFQGHCSLCHPFLIAAARHVYGHMLFPPDHHHSWLTPGFLDTLISATGSDVSTWAPMRVRWSLSFVRALSKACFACLLPEIYVLWRGFETLGGSDGDVFHSNGGHELPASLSGPVMIVLTFQTHLWQLVIAVDQEVSTSGFLPCCLEQTAHRYFIALVQSLGFTFCCTFTSGMTIIITLVISHTCHLKNCNCPSAGASYDLEFRCC